MAEGILVTLTTDLTGKHHEFGGMKLLHVGVEAVFVPELFVADPTGHLQFISVSRFVMKTHGVRLVESFITDMTVNLFLSMRLE